MALDRKREPEVIPQYSLTGDLLSFLRCGLQYRYHNGSELPPSRPIQLWFGEFIHGIMESAYRIWKSSSSPPFPWPSNPTPYLGRPPSGRQPHDIGKIGDIVEGTLSAQGKNPRSQAAREAAYRRAERAVNVIGPHLFPLVAAAEEKVIGTRDIPHPAPSSGSRLRAERYELHGVIDVVTNIELSSVPENNILRQAISGITKKLTGNYEVLIDYKGTRRPAISHPFWSQGEWQLQTYAWLRTRQPGSLPVVAGILLYINELAPGNDDMEEFKKEIVRKDTDVFPIPGSKDEALLNTWKPKNKIPDFSQELLISRAMRVIPITPTSQISATVEFDKVVKSIEMCIQTEVNDGKILKNWEAGGDEDTCAACDFRHFCPNPAPRKGLHKITSPHAP